MPKVSIRNHKVKKIQKGGEDIISNCFFFIANFFHYLILIGVVVAIIAVVVFVAMGKI